MTAKQKRIIPIAACLAVIVGVTAYYLFAPILAAETTGYVCIDRDDDIDSVCGKLSAVSRRQPLSMFKILARHSGYAQHIKTGRYAIKPGEGSLATFRHLRGGTQEPVRLTIPSVRTLERLSAELSKRLMMDSAEVCAALKDTGYIRRLGFDTATIICMFIPNTYEVYWNISVDGLFGKMQTGYKTFWNVLRMEKARQMGMSPTEVMTLASIVDEETANDAEKPMIAGMYYNRLRLRSAEYPDGMPLQADPTIKFAWRQFGLRRIYHKLLHIDSPYNTYQNSGLPPGPIRIPSVAGIDAVLNYTHHDYLYMCAKEDFSGTHNFARTYSEHAANARSYSRALNSRGIK